MSAWILVFIIAAALAIVMYCAVREDRHKIEATRLATIRRRLESFSFLSDGWNGYDAKPISPKVISRAWTIIHSMEMAGTTYGWEAFPVATGTILFEFSNKKHDYFVEIYEDKYVMECDYEEQVSTNLSTVWNWMRRKKRIK